MTVLVVVAHPDDESLGAGGTIARLTAAGRPVSWLVLGEGTTSRGPVALDDLAGQSADCRAAAAVLGVSDVEQSDLPDNAFDSVPVLRVARLVERAVDRVRPSLVLTHHAGDLNVDHRVTHEAVLVATRPVPGCPVRTVAAFEVPSSTEWTFGRGESFVPSLFVDVTATLEQKLDALAAYASEMRPFPHPRSPEAVRALAATRGASVGVAAAECFQVVRALR